MADSLIGRRLGGRYRVDEYLGSGAMGDVYRGWDERLSIPVAIKVITASLTGNDARVDFQQEAKKLAKIRHGNVAMVYDSYQDGDLDYIVMEYVPGVTMDQRARAGPLQESEVVRLGIQLAQGMKAAHDQGIVHSDLKPANVRVTEGGTLKILDFGIARTVKATDATATQDPRMVKGSPAYMAPEQMRAGDADIRSDIYSAGTLLFQVATGHLPFQDREIRALAYKVQNVAPPRPCELNRAISPGLEAILLKCLEKDPQDRYASAEQLEHAFQTIGQQQPTPPRRPTPPIPPRPKAWWETRIAKTAGLLLFVGIVVALSWPTIRRYLGDQLSTRGPTGITRLAVMPFLNLSAQADREYLSDGIAVGLSTRIGQLDYGRLRVVGFPATIRYKGRPIDLDEIRKTLGVAYVLNGSVTSTESVLLINVHLSDTESGTQRWSREYQGSLSEAMDIQRSIADSIAASLAIELLGGVPAGSRTEAPSDAGYDRYLRGQFHLEQGIDFEQLTSALSDFKAAIASDPNQAAFHAELARTHVLLENYGFEAAEEAMPRALASARTALALDSNLAMGHAAMASVLQDYEREWKAAESEYQQAIRLDPSSPAARQEYATLLLITGRKDAAIEQLNAALELDPLSLTIHRELGAYFYLTGNYPRALEQFDRAIELHPDAAIAHYQKGVALISLDRQADAVEAIAKAMRLEGASDTDITAMRRAFKTAGLRGYWQWKLDRLVRDGQSTYVSAFKYARAYAALGDQDHAFQFLNLSAEQRESALAGIVVDPLFNSLRNDPRYQVLLSQLRLTAS